MLSLAHDEPQRLDKQASQIIHSLSAVLPPPGVSAGSVRQHYAESRRPLFGPKLPVASVDQLGTAGPDGPHLTLFRPPGVGAGSPSTYLFLHGGGWTVGDLATYEALCRRLCTHLKANIIFVDYRLAPEHPYPAALQDADHACRFVFENAVALGFNPERIGLIGDSAGANLAAVLALLNRNGKLGRKFLAQVLIYPCLDLTNSLPSHMLFGQGYLLTSEVYDWYIANYAAGHNRRDWRISPLLTPDVSGVAPAVILNAGFDILRDEASAYVERLRQAKVPVKKVSFPDMIHGFINMAGGLSQADLAVQCIRASLHTLLANRRPVRN